MGHITSSESKKRRPALAGLLSLLTPGLGQLYNGDAGRFLSLYAANLIILGLSGWMVGKFKGAVLWLSIALAFQLYAIVDAAWGSIRVKAMPLKAYNRWYVYLGVYLVTAFPIRYGIPNATTHYKAYHVPAGSMGPTLLIDDHFIADKKHYEKADPTRGDVVLVEHPDSGDIYVKRVIGLPGEVLEIRSKVVFVGGNALDEPYVQHSDPGVSSARDDFGAVTIPPGTVFLMGDNRDNSRDSRFWVTRFIPMSSLRGRALYIYWSKERGRIGRGIQ